MTTDATTGNQGRQGRSRRVPRWSLLVLAAVVLAVFLLAGWMWLSGRAASDVTVSWEGGPRCEGATVTTPRPRHPPVIKARSGMHCVITLVISNESGHTVRLERVIAPYLGRGGGAVVVARPAPEADPDGGNDHLDAYFDLDSDLPDQQSTRFEIGVGFRDSGCSAATTTMSHWPTVEVTVLGRTFENHAVDDLSFVQDGFASGCQRS